MRTTQITKDSTETLVTYPPFDSDGLFQASAADVRIRTPAESITAEGSELTCTINATDTTLSSAAARGDTSLTVASGTGLVRQEYYLVEDGGNRFPVFVSEFSGTTVYIDGELKFPISNGAAFKGLSIKRALTSAQTSIDGRTGLAKFRATLNGVQREWDQWFEVVRQTFPLTLSAAKLLRRGDVRRMYEREDVGMRQVIEDAWEQTLRRKLRAANMLEENINTPTEIEPAHVEAVILHLLRYSNADEETVDAQERRLDAVIADVKASSKMRYDETEEDSAPSDERAHLAPWEVPSLSR